MKKNLSPWCKRARIAMIEQELSVSDLAKLVGMSREYTSSVVNGRVYSESAMKKISYALNIFGPD